MERKASSVVLTSAGAVLCAFAAFFVLRGAPHQWQPAMSGKRERVTAEAAPIAHHPAPPPPQNAMTLSKQSPPSPATAKAKPELDETTLMETLRELRGSDPGLTLRLAREGNERFKDSPSAAERLWFIVKSLSDLGRHDEARLEGRALVDKYGPTPWAEDVYRHLFVNPPTHPLERGYGKVLEFDP